MAAWLGKDVAKLKNKGGKWKYCTEKEMLEHSAKFSPYRSVLPIDAYPKSEVT
jgi:DNA-3-methyladenine glycosylase II